MEWVSYYYINDIARKQSPKNFAMILQTWSLATPPLPPTDNSIKNNCNLNPYKRKNQFKCLKYEMNNASNRHARCLMDYIYLYLYL